MGGNRAKGQSTSGGEEAGDRLGLVYSYTPHTIPGGSSNNESNEKNTEGGEEGILGDADGSFSAKSGRWQLGYKDEVARQEFERFCHRALDGAVIMIPYTLRGFVQLATVPNATQPGLVLTCSFVGLLAFALDLTLHCVKRGGKRFTYNVARVRHAAHIVTALVVCISGTSKARNLDISCPSDSVSQQFLCERSVHSATIVALTIALNTLTMNISVHWIMTTFMIVLQVVGLFIVPFVLAEGEAAYSVGENAIFFEARLVRLAVVVMVAQVSNLSALVKHRSLQRGFEASITVHKGMQQANSRLEAVDSLLCSMVPPSALIRLVAGERVVDHTPDATVLFSDMVEFTRWSSQRSPSQVVATLSVLIRGLDTLAVEMDVSKVKTIGDCYWAVTGIPTPMHNHAEVMVAFGLAMVALVRKEGAKHHDEWQFPPDSESSEEEQQKLRDRQVEFRVGIHSGPVLGGVLGSSQQISYEVFGDTSTVANWVEAKGVPMMVVVSEETRKLVRDTFQFQPRLVEVKKSQYPPFPQSRRKSSDVVTGASLLLNAEDDDEKPSEGESPPSGDGATTNSESEPQEEEEVPVRLYIVLREDAAVWDNQSNVSSAASLAITAGSVMSNDEQDDERAKRRKFVEAQMAAKESDDTSGDASARLDLSPESLSQLTQRFSLRKHGCGCMYAFADTSTEAQFQQFVVKELISLRLGGSVALTAVALIIFALFVADAQQEISAPCAVLVTLGLFIDGLSVVFASLRKSALQNIPAITESSEGLGRHQQPWTDIFGPIVSHVGAMCFIIGSFLAPNTIVTNDIVYCVPLGLFLATMPNLHLPSLILLGMASTLCIIPAISVVLGVASDSSVILDSVFSTLWVSMYLVLQEKRLRVQFLEKKVALHYAQQQQVAVQAQEAVLGSIVPDFVIPPLMAWLASDFDPQKTVAVHYDSTCVAFIKLTPGVAPAVASTTDTASSMLVSDDVTADVEWVFQGHQTVDAVLATSSVVDKVKTVGDLVMVAGSFRGHSGQEAASAMLAVVVEIHRRFSNRRRDEPETATSVTIGLHAGPVMGIVLGYSRLAFDIFGDAVNTSSRVMSCPVAKHAIAASTSFTDLLPKETPFRLESLLSGGKGEEDAASPGFVEYGPPCQVVAKGKGTLEVRRVVCLNERGL